MPNEILKKALNGHETELIEITWRIQNNQLEPGDKITIENTADSIINDLFKDSNKKDPNKNQNNKNVNVNHALYLLLCLYVFNSPDIKQDKDKGNKIFEYLINQKFYYAQNLAYLLLPEIERPPIRL